MNSIYIFHKRAAHFTVTYMVNKVWERPELTASMKRIKDWILPFLLPVTYTFAVCHIQERVTAQNISLQWLSIPNITQAYQYTMQMLCRQY